MGAVWKFAGFGGFGPEEKFDGFGAGKFAGGFDGQASLPRCSAKRWTICISRRMGRIHGQQTTRRSAAAGVSFFAVSSACDMGGSIAGDFLPRAKCGFGLRCSGINALCLC